MLEESEDLSPESRLDARVIGFGLSVTTNSATMASPTTVMVVVISLLKGKLQKNLSTSNFRQFCYSELDQLAC